MTTETLRSFYHRHDIGWQTLALGSALLALGLLAYYSILETPFHFFAMMVPRP